MPPPRLRLSPQPRRWHIGSPSAPLPPALEEQEEQEESLLDAA